MFCSSITVQTDHILGFPWQKWLRERATILRYITLLILYNTNETYNIIYNLQLKYYMFRLSWGHLQGVHILHVKKP